VKWAALKESDADRLDFWGNREPKCPHRGKDINIGANDMHDIYEEGEHEATCPWCDLDFIVSTEIRHFFSTDEQHKEDPNAR